MNQDIINYYKKTSIYTNYGIYKSYYCTLPDDLFELSKLIFFQTIHRVSLRNMVVHENGEGKYPWYQYRLHDDILLTAPAMTAELFRMDTRGFSYAREDKHKIVVTCRYVSVLMASILKAKGYSCRVRSGFAGYFIEGIALDHWIVQYWDTNLKKWCNLDTEYVSRHNEFSMPDDQYCLAPQAWLDVRSGKKDVNYFVHGNKITGLPMLARSLFFDFHALMNDEISYLFFPTYIDDDSEFYNLTVDDLKELDDLATLMLDPDKNFDQLRYYFRNDKKFRAINTPLLSDYDHAELIEKEI